jgi:hypothetical protein
VNALPTVASMCQACYDVSFVAIQCVYNMMVPIIVQNLFYITMKNKGFLPKFWSIYRILVFVMILNVLKVCKYICFLIIFLLIWIYLCYNNYRYIIYISLYFQNN